MQIALRRPTPRTKHRARAPLARLRLVEAPSAEVCRDCGGQGFVKVSTGWKLDEWVAVPCRCRDRIAA
jgi:hypothetical protein